MKTGHFVVALFMILLAHGNAWAEGTTPAAAYTPVPAVQTASEPLPEQRFSAERMKAVGLGERILMRGTEGEDVELLQARLAELGYYLGEIDGVFGRGTRSAVYGFQRAHGLAKVDGKAGPETIGRMFSEDVIIKPTPTPSPTPSPSPTPIPTPTPAATPTPTPKPDAAAAPFALEEMGLVIAGEPVTLVLGRDEAGDLLYPLCGVMANMGYEYVCEEGSWQLTRGSDGREIALMTAGQDGLCAGAMGAADGVVFLSDDALRVYAYGQEAYLNAAALEAFGVRVSMSGETPVIR